MLEYIASFHLYTVTVRPCELFVVVWWYELELVMLNLPEKDVTMKQRADRMNISRTLMDDFLDSENVLDMRNFQNDTLIV